VRKLNGCDAAGKAAGNWCTEYSSSKGPPVITMIHPGAHEVPDEAPPRIVEFFKSQVRK
jgi:polyhydroxybutyrate depolymerase